MAYRLHVKEAVNHLRHLPLMQSEWSHRMSQPVCPSFCQCLELQLVFHSDHDSDHIDSPIISLLQYDKTESWRQE